MEDERILTLIEYQAIVSALKERNDAQAKVNQILTDIGLDSKAQWDIHSDRVARLHKEE